VGLDVGVLGAEQGLAALDGEVLGDVHLLAAAVVAPAGIALGVLVGHHAALGLQDRGTGEVLRGDHLQGRALAALLALDGGRDGGVGLGDVAQGGKAHGWFRVRGCEGRGVSEFQAFSKATS
jgi:hypothetical protein